MRGDTRSGRRVAALIVVGALSLPATARAATPHPGSLDPSFNGTGRATAIFGTGSAYAYGVGHQGSSIILVGTREAPGVGDVAVARFTPAGKLDHTFGGGDGRATIDVAGTYDDGRAMAVLADGKILIAGESIKGSTHRFLAIRLLPDGRLDRSFGGGDGIVVTGLPGGGYGTALTVLRDGRFEICGSSFGSGISHAAVVRYLPGGRLDDSFGTAGRAVLSFPNTNGAECYATTHLGNRTVVVGTASTATGFDIAVARLGPGGLPDTTFNGDGYGLFAESVNGVNPQGVVPLPNGKVVLAGTISDASGRIGVLLQLTAAGRLDKTFGAGGGVVLPLNSPEVEDVVRQPNGRFLVVGAIGFDMFVARYRPGGTRDTSFGHNGIQKMPWASISVATSVMLVGEKIVAAGYVIPGQHHFAVERLFGG